MIAFAQRREVGVDPAGADVGGGAAALAGAGAVDDLVAGKTEVDVGVGSVVDHLDGGPGKGGAGRADGDKAKNGKQT